MGYNDQLADIYYGGRGHTYPCPPHYHGQQPPPGQQASSQMLPPSAFPPSNLPMKQKRSHKRKIKDESGTEDDLDVKPFKKRKQEEEKRLRRFRPKAPQSYDEIRSRALTQRMFVVDRQRHEPQDPTLDDAHPTETISLAGTTGNIYQITIDKLPSCTCPHAKKGNQCKHIVYCMTRVLRARADLEYQLALLSSELREIFANAPALPSATAADSEKDGNRKPLEDCGICCEDFDTKGESEEVVYCKAACGNNIHKQCFNQWAATKRGGGVVTCPYCRSPWQTDGGDIKQVAQSGPVNEEGYVNVASELGLSGERDYSTYHQYWVRRHLGEGYDF